MSDKSILYLFLYTGKDMNELGDYKNCKKNNGYYVVLKAMIQGVAAMTLGGCVPLACNAEYLQDYREDIAIYLNSLQNQTVFDEDDIVIYGASETNKEVGSARMGSVISTAILCGFVVMAVVLTIMEYCEQETGNKAEGGYTGIRKFLSCFSLSHNAKSLFYSENKLDKKLDILNGLRVLAMIWIILGHSLVELLLYPVYNYSDIMTRIKNSRGLTWITSGTLGVDIFFLLSAFLATLSCMSIFSELKNRKLSSVLLIYLQRYIRLLPIYIIGFITAIYIVPLLYDGPIYERITFLQKYCSSNWGANIIYLNNFIKPNDMCLPWTWYLATDFQMFLVVPLIVLLYYYKAILAYAACGVLAIVSCIIQAVVFFKYKISLNLFDYESQKSMMEFYYIKPYCRINAYLLGIFFAWMYLQSKVKEKAEESTENKETVGSIFRALNRIWARSTAVRYFLYLLGLVLIVVVLYTYPDFYNENVSPNPSIGGPAAYTILGRIAFLLGIMFLFYPYLLGKCKIGIVLAVEFWAPLARSTYCAYMIHLVVFGYYYSSLEEGVYFTIHKVIINGLDVLVITYLLSLLISVVVEAPIIQLTKAYLFKEKGIEGKKDSEKLLEKPNKEEEKKQGTTKKEE